MAASLSAPAASPAPSALLVGSAASPVGGSPMAASLSAPAASPAPSALPVGSAGAAGSPMGESRSLLPAASVLASGSAASASTTSIGTVELAATPAPSAR